MRRLCRESGRVMYLAVEFNGNYGRWETFTETEWTELRAAVPTLPEEVSKWGPSGTHVLDEKGVATVAKYGLSISLANGKDTCIGTMLVKLQDKIAALEMKADNTAALIRDGLCVQIAIPDLALLSINEVTYLEDACTDQVQEHLDEGWRMLAVCPPNAQRRPDYIFGRRKG